MHMKTLDIVSAKSAKLHLSIEEISGRPKAAATKNDETPAEAGVFGRESQTEGGGGGGSLSLFSLSLFSLSFLSFAFFLSISFCFSVAFAVAG